MKVPPAPPGSRPARHPVAWARAEQTGEDVAGFLEQVCDEARARVDEAARIEPLDALRERALSVGAPPAFSVAIARPGVAVIAEVKRASPSRGVIAEIPDPAQLAAAYGAGGAAAVSVLTEPRHFNGSLADLRAVSDAVALPTLRKDFVVDPYQVWEARATGAAAILLIVAALSVDALSALLDTVGTAGLDALVEVHDDREVATALTARAQADDPPPLLLGVNARDLRTLQVDMRTFARVRASAPDDALLIAESGVTGHEDVHRLARAGAQAVLVGEHLVRAPDPVEAVRRLVGADVPSDARSLHVH